MNERPPTPEPADDLDVAYRQLSQLDPGAPGAATRRAILTHAHKLARKRLQAQAATSKNSWRGFSWRLLGRPAAFGTLAAAIVAGLVIVPRYLLPDLPSVAPPPIDTIIEYSAPATKPPSAPASETAPVAAAEPSQRAAGHAATARSEAGVSAARVAAPPAPVAHNSATPGVAPTPAAPVGAMGGRDLHSADTAISNTTTTHVAASAAVATTDAAAPFRHAAEVGDLVQLEALSRRQADLNARDGLGRTALMLAVLHHQTAAASALLAYGADPNGADANGVTPLQAARAQNAADLVAALRLYGAR
jgi:Ankyrin repeats (many copies)